MATVTNYGLGQEGGVLNKLCTTDTEVLAPRGINAEFLTSLNTSITTMTDLSSDATLAVETTGELTGQEEDWRTKVLQDCSRVTDIVKIALPKGATWKPFHIGDKLSQSTRTILKRANDCLKAAKKHKPALMAKGLLQSDIDTLESDISQLQATDASQETSKRSDAPTATAACRKATNDVKQMCDQIHAVASAAFKGNSAKLKPYKEAKKLRYLPAPRKAKATTTTTDAKAAAATAGTTEAKK